MNLKDFTAEDARQLKKNFNNDELMAVLDEIKQTAEIGKTDITIYKPLSLYTRNELTHRGFKIGGVPSIATQKDGVYYTISW